MRILFCFAVVWIWNITLAAQTIITGTVLSSRSDTLVGANVWLRGTFDGATADPAGGFRFVTSVTDTQQLLITCIGYDTFRQTLVLQGGTVLLTPRLRESAAALQEVVISAGSFEAASDRRRAVVLSPIDIALTASATADIAGAVTTLPGTVHNGESGQILVRGGAGYETRTFIDGLYVQNPYNSSVPNVPARNRFSPFLFKGTQFSTGGYSAEYGQALSSALILQTEDLAPKTTTGLSVMSVGLGLAHTQRWKRSSLSASVSYSNLAPYFVLVSQELDWLTPPQSGGGEVIFRQKVSDTGMFKVYSSVNRSRMELHYPDPFRPQDIQPLHLQADNVYTNLSYRDILNDKWALFAGGAYTYNRDQIASGFRQDTRQQSGQFRVTLTRGLGDKAKLKFGAEYLQGHFNEYIREDGTAAHHTLRSETYGAGFVEGDLYFSRRFVARAGLRAEHSTLLGRASLAPRLSAAWVIRKDEQIAFAAGRFYQTPEYTLLRFNTDLRFEQATHYMLNYQRIRNGYTFRIEGYYKQYDDLVKIDTATGLSNNRGAGFARGIDIFFRDRKSIRNGDYWVSYSFLDTRRDYRDFPGPAVPTFAARHHVSIVYKHWLPKMNTAFGATCSFQSPRPYHDPNRPGFNQGRTPVYQDLSINASYLTNIGGHFTILYVSATNILGLNQTFGYQFGTEPGDDGLLPSRAIRPPARHFLFAGLFINFGQHYRADETTTDDL